MNELFLQIKHETSQSFEVITKPLHKIILSTVRMWFNEIGDKCKDKRISGAGFQSQ